MRLIAGLDAAYRKGMAYAAACLYTFPELEPIGDALCEVEAPFPYVPGYLTFREGPALVCALRRLKARPDLLLIDGQGIAHPGGMGIAAHLGAALGMASIGCAKSRLTGSYREPGRRRGAKSALVDDAGREIGAVVRTRDGVRPVFVSVGNMIDLEGAIEVVLKTTRGFRVPEPLRRADMLSKKAAREAAGG